MIEDYFEGNPSINACIYECFQHLDARDVTAFKRKLKSYSRLADKGEFFHTFRELIVGSYLARSNLLARSDQRVQWQKKYGTLTPDWSILGRRSEPAGLVEVMNFHADRQTEIYVRAALDAGRIACFPYDEVKTEQRLRSNIIEKCKYKDLTELLNVRIRLLASVSSTIQWKQVSLGECCIRRSRACSGIPVMGSILMSAAWCCSASSRGMCLWIQLRWFISSNTSLILMLFGCSHSRSGIITRRCRSLIENVISYLYASLRARSPKNNFTFFSTNQAAGAAINETHP